jgi:hypothetical protein
MAAVAEDLATATRAQQIRVQRITELAELAEVELVKLLMEPTAHLTLVVAVAVGHLTVILQVRAAAAVLES